MITINTMKGTMVDRVFKVGEQKCKKKLCYLQVNLVVFFKCYEKIFNLVVPLFIL